MALAPRTMNDLLATLRASLLPEGREIVRLSLSGPSGSGYFSREQVEAMLEELWKLTVAMHLGEEPGPLAKLGLLVLMDSAGLTPARQHGNQTDFAPRD